MPVDLQAAARARALVAIILLLATAAACARRTPPPVIPTAAKYPEFMAPAVPQALQRAPGVEHIDLGWRYLQNDDLRNATREFAAALKRNPGLYPAQAGEGYVALAERDHDRALAAFDAALRGSSTYVPALVGRGQTLLALKRDDQALAAFEAALAADPALTDVQRRVEVLRFRNVQQTIEAARTAASARRTDEARLAYQRALTMSPDTPFLHRELGAVERQAGNGEAALVQFRRAVELDPSDAASLVQVGDILMERGDFAGAEAAYRKAASIEPDPALTARIAAVVEGAREARLPAEFKAIGGTQPVTRGDLAALLGVRLERVLRAAPSRQAVMTDTRGHWAANWIAEVARAGVIEPFENHTFQPRTPVRRGDLAAAVSRVVSLLAASDPALRKQVAARPAIADMSTGHLSYPAVGRGVCTRGLARPADRRCGVNRVVTGAEALQVVERLSALAR